MQHQHQQQQQAEYEVTAVQDLANVYARVNTSGIR